MKEYAEKEKNMAQLKRMLISSLHQTNGTLSIPWLLVHLILGLVCKKSHRFVHYITKNCFNTFVQSAVTVRCQGDEIPNYSVVTEIIKILADSSYGYQIKDCSRHTVTKYLDDEKTHSEIISKLLKGLNHITDQLYEVDLAKPEIEPRESIIVGVFIQQDAKQKMLELYDNSSKSFVTLRSMKNLKWAKAFSTWLCRNKTWKTLFSLKIETSGKQWDRRVDRHFHCQRNRQFVSKNVLQHTQGTQ